MRRKTYDYTDKKDMEFWYRRTHSGQLMAEIFHCSPVTIYNWLHKHGIQLEDKAAGRTPKLLIINGKAHTVPEWAKIAGIPRTTLYTRIRLGYKGDELLWGKRN